MSRAASIIAESSALWALAILLVGAAAASWSVTRLRSSAHPPMAWFAASSTVCLILAVTMFRDGWQFAWNVAGMFEWSGTGWSRLSGNPLGSPEFVLNLLLFVPAGIAWTRILRAPGVVVAGAAALALAIESLQGITGAGAPDIADLAANTAGGAVGVGAAVAVRRIWNGPTLTPEASRRRRLLVAGSVAAVVVVWFGGAGFRQRSIERELRDAFDGTSLEQVEGWRAGDGNQSERLYGAISARSDGVTTVDDAIEVRYPATFFGLRRCVFVTWSPAGLDYRRASGSECTVFVG